MNFLKPIALILMLLTPFIIYPSDRSDAADLMNQCDKNVKALEIAVVNFGDKNEKASYDNALNVIKLGKVKLAQSNFLDAKARFEEYLKIENDIYASLSPGYMQRSQELIDKISVDLVDFVTNPNVLKNFTESDTKLKEAKAFYNSKNYKSAVISSRTSKFLVINCYVYAKKEIPKEYKKDLEDYYNRIYKE